MANTNILQPGDCVLFGGKSFISRGIKWFTGSKYSHVAVYVGGGEGFCIEATAAGVEKNPVAPLMDAAECYEIRRIPNLTVENAELMKAAAYQLLTDHEPYDFLQLLSLGLYFGVRKIFGKAPAFLVKNTPGHMICSELFAVCALTIPIKFKKKTKLVTPQTLAETDLMSTVLTIENK